MEIIMLLVFFSFITDFQCFLQNKYNYKLHNIIHFIMKSRKIAPRYIHHNTFITNQPQYPSFIPNTKQWQPTMLNYTSRSKDLQITQQKIGLLYSNKIDKSNSNEKYQLNNKQCLNIMANRMQTTKVDQIEIQDKEKVEIIRVSEKKILLDTPQCHEKKQQQQLDFRKIGVLKRLLEHYNLKNLKRRHYQKLINTFGLRIQSVKYESNSKTKQKFIRKERNSATTRRLDQITSQRKGTQYSPNRNTFNQNKHNYLDYVRQTFKLQQKLNNQNKKQQRKFSKQVKIYSEMKKNISIRRPSTGQKTQKVIRQKQKQKQKPLKYTTEKDSFEVRLKKFKQFLFLINFSNQIYRNMQIQQYQTPFKYYVGKGNNANLIHSVMKKRFWFVQTDSQSQSNFIWTQIKIQQIFKKQQNCQNKLILQKKQDKRIQIKSDRNLTIISPTKRGARMYEPINPYLKILSAKEYKIYNETVRFLQNTAHNDFQHKIKYMKKQLKIDLSLKSRIIHNHLPSNQLLGNKKAMFYCLRQYYKLIGKDVFSIVPLTFHIQDGIRDDQFKKFINYYNERKKFNKPNIWIIKPGQQTNRGNGISCSNKIDEIRKKLSSSKKTKKRTFILQSYITRPFLYFRRKFDIRAYMLITMNNGILKGYWYQQGYIRTSSSYFDLEDLEDPMIHLTNDAIQKNGEEYGRFEQGNKLSYNQLERYLESIGSKFNFYQMVYPEMRRIATDSIKSTALFLDSKKKQNNFEIFGLDFMIDENFKVWLIQINTNPCLELSCGILQRLIPHMVQNAFRIGLDPVFPPPNNFLPSRKYNISQNALFYNKFELIFDEIRDGDQLKSLFIHTKLLQAIGIVQQDKEQYQNEGEIIQIQNE